MLTTPPTNLCKRVVETPISVSEESQASASREPMANRSPGGHARNKPTKECAQQPTTRQRLATRRVLQGAPKAPELWIGASKYLCWFGPGFLLVLAFSDVLQTEHNKNKAADGRCWSSHMVDVEYIRDTCKNSHLIDIHKPWGVCIFSRPCNGTSTSGTNSLLAASLTSDLVEPSWDKSPADLLSQPHRNQISC